MAPNMTPVPGTITRAPKSWPIDNAQATAPPFSSIAAKPEKPPESAGAPAAGPCWPCQPAKALAPASGGGAT